MWLLTTTSLRLEFFHDASRCRYAIVSHTWTDDEVSFQEIQLKSEDLIERKGYQKVVSSCEQARRDGFRYVWIDTCW